MSTERIVLAQMGSEEGEGKELTQREIECLYWAEQGKTDNEIGAILNIGGRTVRFHIRNAKAKLGFKTRIQAIVHIVKSRFMKDITS